MRLIIKPLPPMQMGRLEKLLWKEYRCNDGAILPLAKIIVRCVERDNGVFEKECANGDIDFNKRHFNQLDYAGQRKYEARLKAKTNYYINNLKVPKMVFDNIDGIAEGVMEKLDYIFKCRMHTKSLKEKLIKHAQRYRVKDEVFFDAVLDLMARDDVGAFADFFGKMDKTNTGYAYGAMQSEFLVCVRQLACSEYTSRMQEIRRDMARAIWAARKFK